MRIIAGEFRSRRLKSVPGNATRPTPDRLRESLFNILQTRIPGTTFLDAYAGTGAVGIEALSRGASHVFFLERDKAALEAIRENLETLGAGRRATVASGAVLRNLIKFRADLVFLDPPYSLHREYEEAMDLLAANPPAVVIAQHDVRFELKPRYGDLLRTRVVRQGDNALSFFAPEPVPEAPV